MNEFLMSIIRDIQTMKAKHSTRARRLIDTLDHADRVVIRTYLEDHGHLLGLPRNLYYDRKLEQWID